MSDVASRAQVLGLTAQIVSAHVSHNAIPSDALSGLIQSVFRTLSTVGVDAPVPDKPQPAVPVKKSVFPDHIVCLEDGKKLKMLKRHLQTSYQMTPEQYRERWGLPADYPMVAPNYAERRSSLAKKIGLGRKRVAVEPDPEPAPLPPPAPAKPSGRGRRAKIETE
jgi:predicted transcriptional regulator